jgi:hypothetical protein
VQCHDGVKIEAAERWVEEAMQRIVEDTLCDIDDTDPADRVNADVG